MQNVKLHYVYREPNFKTVWDLEKEKAITHLIIFLKKPKKKKKWKKITILKFNATEGAKDKTHSI